MAPRRAKEPQPLFTVSVKALGKQAVGQREAVAMGSRVRARGLAV